MLAPIPGLSDVPHPLPTNIFSPTAAVADPTLRRCNCRREPRRAVSRKGGAQGAAIVAADASDAPTLTASAATSGPPQGRRA